MTQFLCFFKHHFHWFAAAILLGAGMLGLAMHTLWLPGLMLFLPLLDPAWQPPSWRQNPRQLLATVMLLLFGAGLLFMNPDRLEFAISTLAVAALPEEWFFRAYLMSRIDKSLGSTRSRTLRTNLLTSFVFSLLHGITRGPLVALQVFIPSLFFGWIYQRNKNIVLVILLHALSNLIFVLFLARWL